MNAMAGLTGLNLSNLGLTQVPDLSQLPGLTHIDLSGNDLTRLSLSPNVPLRSVIAADNKLSMLTDELDAFTGLEELVLDGNHLTALPDLSAFGALRVFRAADNALTGFPGLNQLPNLVEVDISNNQLASLAPYAPNSADLNVMLCQDNLLAAYEDCLAIDALQRSGIDTFEFNPQAGGRPLVCFNVEELDMGRVVWGNRDARFCGSISPDIRDFICFLNNDSSCPPNPCEE